MPVVLVRKKDEGIRFCVDHRQMNRITKADAYTMPRLDQAIDELSGTKWIMASDAKSACLTIETEPKNWPKMVFSDGFRLLNFRRMPVGLATTSLSKSYECCAQPKYRETCSCLLKIF